MEEQRDPNQSQDPPVKLYIGSKIIKGIPMFECAFLKDVKGEDISEKQSNQPGYKVEYPDGYVSWSPKEVFENAYREISPAEFKLLSSHYFF